MSLRNGLAFLVCLLLVLSLASIAGAVTRYDGIDPGAYPTDPRPNSNAAAAAFDAAAGALGAIELGTFEGLPVGDFTTLEIYPGVTATFADVDAGSGVRNDADRITGYNTTMGGSKYIGVWPIFDIGTCTLTLEFDDPIHAFGGYFTGVGTANGDLFVEYADGGITSLPITGYVDGGVLFFGFTDPGAMIVEITLALKNVVGSSRDIWGLDDMRFVITEIPLYVDIKPGSCPNPLNVKSQGVLPVAILGTDDFDVFDIDPESIELVGVEPIRWSWEDVGTPIDKIDPCDCWEYGADGYMDLMLHFDTQAIVAAIGAVNDGDIKQLVLTAMTDAGIPAEGMDCVRMLVKGKTPPPPPPGIKVAVFDGTSTMVMFSLPSEASGSVDVLDVQGRLVRTLVSGTLPAGTQTLQWDGRDEAGNAVASGIYFCSLRTDGFCQTAKVALTK